MCSHFTSICLFLHLFSLHLSSSVHLTNSYLFFLLSCLSALCFYFSFLSIFSLCLFVCFQWCGHCQRLAPELDSLAGKVSTLASKGREVIVAKIDGPSNPKADSRFGVTGYPTLYLFKGGNMYEYTGSRQAEAMYRWLQFGWKRAKAIQVPS